MILFSDDTFNQHNEKKTKFNTNVTKVLDSELEVCNISEEELTEEEVVSEENEDNESEKEDEQDSNVTSDDEYIEEEDDEIQDIQQMVDDKIEPIQHNDTADLRTELKRRRALRLNMVKLKCNISIILFIIFVNF